jgi:glycosyltransferase involved in cell wall biosynthesis
MLISVLLPYYNASLTINETISSIRVASHRVKSEVQLIVVDDCSNVPLSDILTKENLEFSTVYRLNKNSGIVAALNYGLDRCDGRYIARIDSDDLMEPQRLERQLLISKSSGASVISSQITCFSDEKSRLQSYYYPISHEAIKFGLCYGNPIAHPSVFVDADTLRYYKYLDFLETRGMEDYYLWYRMAADNVIFQGDATSLTKYRISANQISRHFTQEVIGKKNSIANMAKSHGISNLCDNTSSKRVSLLDRFADISSIYKNFSGLDQRALRQIILSSHVNQDLVNSKSTFISSAIFRLFG